MQRDDDLDSVFGGANHHTGAHPDRIHLRRKAQHSHFTLCRQCDGHEKISTLQKVAALRVVYIQGLG